MNKQNSDTKVSKELSALFKDTALLELALHHRSVKGTSNERLEFLGDSVISLVVREYLYHRYPGAKEGVLSQLSQVLVSNETLSEVATRMNLEILESKSITEMSDRLRANTLEAVVGALFIDSGLPTCRKAVLGWLGRHLVTLPKVPSAEGFKHPKTVLKEFLDSRSLPNPSYEMEPDNEGQAVRVSCSVEGIDWKIYATGRNRATDQKEAAIKFLAELNARESYEYID